jgi:hypothetical protein
MAKVVAALKAAKLPSDIVSNVIETVVVASEESISFLTRTAIV